MSSTWTRSRTCHGDFGESGHAVSELARIPWLGPDHLRGTLDQVSLPRLIYWGDLDTHGFAILSRARGIFSRLQSVLMDEATFSGGQALWVNELKPNRAEELRCLAPSEMDVYSGLREHRWGTNLRLEQERLAWPVCLRALEKHCAKVTTIRQWKVARPWLSNGAPR